eukprot:scaffold205515_cov17-Prasinocladus_malaysianus.AAC.1
MEANVVDLVKKRVVIVPHGCPACIGGKRADLIWCVRPVSSFHATTAARPSHSSSSTCRQSITQPQGGRSQIH